MNQGVKVIINTNYEDGQIINGEGYIMRRLNYDLYEIWSEESQTILTLHRDDFLETDY